MAIFLQLSDELITLLDNIVILLVLVIWPIRLDDAFAGDTVDGAGNTVGCNEFGKITSRDYFSQPFLQAGKVARTGLRNQQ